jgi:hypothetical protein
MDDLVNQALARWPNVPSIAGWLKLSARGDWLLIGEVAAGLKISHQNMRRFIDRNYASDQQGRWYFQNGPQKVFVNLEYTPWVFGLHPAQDGVCLLSHTRIATLPNALYLDEEGNFVFQTPMGPGLLLGTDIEALSAFLTQTSQDRWTLDAPWILPAAQCCVANDWTLDVVAQVSPKPGRLLAQPCLRCDLPAQLDFIVTPVI